MKKVEKYIQKYGMITAEDKVIAGISGGADSVCLFYVLLELQKTVNFEFIAVHINHQLRGADADADEHFVQELCEKNGIKLEIFHQDVVSIAKKRKQSFEEAGRIVRREAFEETMRKYGGTKIALAHHQNDNAETLLMNLARGTGLKGLCGIRPVNGIYIRPLLCMTRREIETYLKERGTAYREDATNSDTTYTRNGLRHLVIPVLEDKVNVQAVRHMNEMMEQICELEEYMEMQTDVAWEACVSCEGEKNFLLSEEPFRKYPEVLQKRLVRRCIEKLEGGLKDSGQVHVRQILDLFEKQSGRCVDLPGNIQAKRGYDGVSIQRKQEQLQEEWKQELVVPGENHFPEKKLTIYCEILEKKEEFFMQNIPQKTYTKWFDYDIIKTSLCVRTKKAGDKIVVKRGQSQKLKSWFINEKIPAEQRGELLLLADGSQILWVIGHRMSSAYQVTESTQRILQVKITEEKEDGRQD